MRIISGCLLPVALLLAAMSSGAWAAKDFKIDIKRVEGIVLKVVPDVTVEAVSMSTVPGLYEVIINSADSSKGILYLSVDMKHVVVGSVIDMEQGRNLTEARFNEISRLDVSSIPLEDALVLGNPKARHKVIVFDDPD